MRLELEGVRHVYAAGTPFQVEALKGVSLAVERGEILAVVGGTGSGKSTLAKHLNLLLQPTSGRVLVDGADARELDTTALRRRVGLVFQFPEDALFAPTVEEDVSFAPGRMRLDQDEMSERVHDALETMGVGHLAGRPPFLLSGGEKRRVAIAGVLAMQPEVLVLDEPTAGLDPATRAELLDTARGMRDERGVSVVLISHDLDEVAEVADKVCVLDGGEVRAFGPPREVFYADPERAPATVRAAALVAREHPSVGRPVTFAETLDAMRNLAGSGAT